MNPVLLCFVRLVPDRWDPEALEDDNIPQAGTDGNDHSYADSILDDASGCAGIVRMPASSRKTRPMRVNM